MDDRRKVEDLLKYKTSKAAGLEVEQLLRGLQEKTTDNRDEILVKALKTYSWIVDQYTDGKRVVAVASES
jgi:hypothetical protein